MGVLSSPRALLLLLLIGVDASRRGAFAAQTGGNLAPLEASGLAEEVGAEQHDGGVEGEPLVHSTGTLAKSPALQLLPKAIATLVVLAVAGAAAYYGLKGVSYPRVKKEDLAKHVRAFLDSGKDSTRFIMEETNQVVVLTARWDLKKPELAFKSHTEAEKEQLVTAVLPLLREKTHPASAQKDKETGWSRCHGAFVARIDGIEHNFEVFAQSLIDLKAGRGLGPLSTKLKWAKSE